VTEFGLFQNRSLRFLMGEGAGRWPN